MAVTRGGGDRTHEHGQGLVEFALVFPVIVLLLIAAFDMSRAVYAYASIANAARQGARVAAVNQLYPADSDVTCQESMPVEDLSAGGSPTWSARACAAAAATSLGLTPSNVTVGYAPPSDSDVACPPGPAPTDPPAVNPFHVGCIVSVTVNYPFAPITPLIESFLGTFTMTATSEMPVERVFP